MWFNRQGQPVSMEEGMRLFAAGRQVALTKVGHFTVSTVFCPIAIPFRDQRPLVFETAVFDRSDNDSVHVVRKAASEAEAREVHDSVVSDLLKK